MSVKISPPVRKVSHPKVLTQLQGTGLTNRHSPAKKTTDLVAPQKKGLNRVDGSYAVVLASTRLVKGVRLG